MSVAMLASITTTWPFLHCSAEHRLQALRLTDVAREELTTTRKAAAIQYQFQECSKELSETVIGCAIEVHRTLGAGLLENTYEKCLAYELSMK
ncbi:MAG: GxxExxY protein, partial [Candidatus Polarisedimenticolaceae bacterium]|nr:GxxExxY protein [Candidatus Polarisedimenticolaceae bacterium]